MILPDTSIWIEFFRGREPLFSSVRSLLETRQLMAMECIFAELLQGARTKRERELIHEMWESLPKADRAGSLLAAGEYSGLHRLPESGVGLIDSWIMTCARLTGARVWSLDKKLNSLLKPAEAFSM